MSKTTETPAGDGGTQTEAGRVAALEERLAELVTELAETRVQLSSVAATALWTRHEVIALCEHLAGATFHNEGRAWPDVSRDVLEAGVHRLHARRTDSEYSDTYDSFTDAAYAAALSGATLPQLCENVYPGESGDLRWRPPLDEIVDPGTLRLINKIERAVQQ